MKEIAVLLALAGAAVALGWADLLSDPPNHASAFGWFVAALLPLIGVFDRLWHMDDGGDE